MNNTESATFNDIKAVLNHSVETSVRMSRDGADANPDDFPLVDAGDSADIPPRVLPLVTGAAQRLRDLAAGGNRIPADAGVAPEALALLPQFPRGWSLPKIDSAALAAQIEP